MSDTESLVATATIGADAEEFLASDLGRMLISMAEQEAEEAMDKLKRTHPWRWRRISQLQNDIKRAESFKGWLVELIVSGRQAVETLEEAQATE
jgi:hypothetical protein